MCIRTRSKASSRHRQRLLLAALFAAPLLLVGSGQASAQAVRGRLVDSGTFTPIEGAMVWLVDSRGENAAGFLTNQAGRFLLRAPTPGRYHLRVERIGFATVESPVLTLVTDEILDYRMETAQEAIELEELVVEGEQQCRVRPEEGLQSAVLWEEARKALTTAEWTEMQSAYRFQVLNYQRELEKETLRIDSEQRRYNRGVMRSPIRSRPAEELAELGYIRPAENDSYNFYAPDAEALLSDPFLDTHCFRLAAGEGDTRNFIGLAFEPVRRRGVSDIEGTIWLDRETGHLQFLEFRYTRLPWEILDGRIGGRVEFESLPNGGWIVRRWFIRMPVVGYDPLAYSQNRPIHRLMAFKEAGGEVTDIQTLDQRTILQSEVGSLSGMVWDSIQSAPLSGATVYLRGTDHTTTTDERGRFLLEDLPTGIFLATFSHPRADSLAATLEGEMVSIEAGEHTTVGLALPTFESIVSSKCSPEERGDDTGILFGTVMNAETGLPIPEAWVVVSWSEYDLNSLLAGAIIGESRLGTMIQVDAEGRYLLCSVPARTRLQIRAELDEAVGEVVRATLPIGSYTRLDLVLGLQGPGR